MSLQAQMDPPWEDPIANVKMHPRELMELARSATAIAQKHPQTMGLSLWNTTKVRDICVI